MLGLNPGVGERAGLVPQGSWPESPERETAWERLRVDVSRALPGERRRLELEAGG